MMQNPAYRGNDRQIAFATGEGPALIMAPEKIEFLNPLVDETRVTVLPNGSLQERFGHEGQCAEEVPEDVLAGEDQSNERKRETSFLGGLLRFVGAVVGFVMGGPAGAALGSVMGEVAGDIAAEQTNIIWPKLGRGLPYRKEAHHEEDA
jgi:hypothetical protein